MQLIQEIQKWNSWQDQNDSIGLPLHHSRNIIIFSFPRNNTFWRETKENRSANAPRVRKPPSEAEPEDTISAKIEPCPGPSDRVMQWEDHDHFLQSHLPFLPANFAPIQSQKRYINKLTSSEDQWPSNRFLAKLCFSSRKFGNNKKIYSSSGSKSWENLGTKLPYAFKSLNDISRVEISCIYELWRKS